jgi:AraC-like DNA-binding protein
MAVGEALRSTGRLERLDDSSDGASSECRIRAIALAGFRESLKGYGLEPAPLLAQAQIADDTLKDDFNWLPLEKFARALTLAARATGDPCFGLKYGATARFANPLGYLMSSAPDLRTALKSFVQYQRVFNTNVAAFVERGGSGRIEWDYPVTMTDVAQLTDFVLMRFICRIQSAAGASWHPLSVSVTHHQPTDREEYERRLGPRVAFDQPTNRIVIAGPTLSLPMPGADPELFKLVRRFCDQQVEREKAQDDPLNRTREAIVRCLQRGSVSPKTVADELELSPTSLQRRLKEQGTSFQRLFDDTRRCVAQRYLFESSLQLGEIAAKVGYSELSAFSRAARRWFGSPPRDLRRRQPRFGPTPW